MINNWTYVSIFFGIFYISFILWNRLIRVRLPRELLITNHYDLTFLIILILTVLFGLLFIYYFLNLIKYLPREPGKIIKRVLMIEEKIKDYNFYKFIQQIIKAFMDGPLEFYVMVYNKFYNKTRIIHDGTEKIGLYLFDIFTDYKKLPYLVYLFLIVFPRLIVSMVLVIEVIYLRELNNFYKVLPLLLIPLIVKAYFGILKFHVDQMKFYYERFFSFFYDKETQIFHITIKDLTDPKEIEIQERILKREEETPEGRSSYLQRTWNLYYYMLYDSYRIFIIDIYEKYKNMLYTIYYMLYFIGFLFYLLILIGVY
jgi:hypothetical protein